MRTDLSAAEIDRQFWALVHADEQLLQAEFEELIADVWSSLTTGQTHRAARRREPRGGAPRGNRVTPRRLPAPGAATANSRQRAPPRQWIAATSEGGD